MRINNPKSRLSRRRVLKHTGGAAAFTIGLSQPVVASDGWTEIGDRVFAEMAFVVDSSNLESYGEHDPLSFYNIDDDGNMNNYLITEEMVREFRRKGPILKYNGFHSIPKIVNKETKSHIVPTRVNERLETAEVARMRNPIDFPMIRVNRNTGEEIHIEKIGDESVSINRGQSKRINLQNQRVQTMNGNEVNVESHYIIKNHGNLTIRYNEEGLR